MNSMLNENIKELLLRNNLQYTIFQQPGIENYILSVRDKHKVCFYGYKFYNKEITNIDNDRIVNVKIDDSIQQLHFTLYERICNDWKIK